MNHRSTIGLQQFKENVGIKFQLYNSLFTSLPFHRIEKTGILLSLLLNNCEEGFNKNFSPTDIIEDFFLQYTDYREVNEKLDLLFRFIQYVERQVVLFDALEDASFREIHDMAGAGTLKQLALEMADKNKEDELVEKLKDFSIRLVLTAHPTQFYPGSVLGIINDISKALVRNNFALINTYLKQLGKTPFFKKQKPSPYDEATSLLWYLENVFYSAGGQILSFLKSHFPDSIHDGNPVITMGFWPGGDRDGNPFVNTETTLKVAEALRGGIIKSYYLEIRRLRRRLTFKGVDTILVALETHLYNNIFIPGHKTDLTIGKILDPLNEIKQILIERHDSLFLYLIENLLNKVHIFGLHFASLDIRQDSSIHSVVLNSLAGYNDVVPADYTKLTTEQKMSFLEINTIALSTITSSQIIVTDTLESIRAINTIQQYNGEQGCHRYIISHCNDALNVMEVYGLFILCGLSEVKVDIVPLFETISDLQKAALIMKKLYDNVVYREHLAKRNNRQTIMLGFSDGTKDGGYLMANWSIYKAREELTTVSKSAGIDVVFFDGRGGPPSRGGGKTHNFYASMGKNISNKEIQLTIQGQTVSSSFGTIDSAQFNIEQLIHAGISNSLFSNRESTLTENEEHLLEELSSESLRVYNDLKDHPDFVDYLTHVSPLRFYSETNIASRPAQRSAEGKTSLKDLRAIPFVGAWSQLKQNVTGFYGVGSSLQVMEEKGKFSELQTMYHHSLFFKTLIDNCEMSMRKCFFPLTAFLSDDKKYGLIWKMIYTEFTLSHTYLLKLTGASELMADYPIERLSIRMRERIVLPIETIQQFALTKLRLMQEKQEENPLQSMYEKLIIRCSFGIINAGRNSV